ncbi:PC-Esterase domain-containing protein/PMR5N domain-containing protein [Cephalotus follicularis]|uniref:PC-Esterase domain-containing protein/PMR5N domain-containing protein n=1 Tax=Cephalotus follicularis TaxID=3775 RepID=A0A1Q3B6Y1_CEPFO|nr:PC-Esterase domain-containing protein/PMR5N domain-containing protein [Cephalotus follicularis]
MNLNTKRWPYMKHNNSIIKLLISILLIGFAFRLFFYRSKEFATDVVAVTAFVNETEVPKNQTFGSIPIVEPPVSVAVPGPEDHLEDYDDEKCDLFIGDWIPNPSGPIYTNASCPLIEGHQNCMRNGRPDSGYLYWRWNPRACELPQFDAQRFLDLMRNKTWALIGDSISRNHVQSLLCMLSTVEQAVEVYHDEEYKSKRWLFPLYNFTVSVIWSPFLVEAAIFEDNNGVSTSEVELYLDKLDKKWTDIYQGIDYLIISTGKWFLKSAVYHENDTVIGCHYCPKRNLTELGFDFAYSKALRSVMNFIATSHHNGLIFFRTSTPDHFENGEWHNGGTCQGTTPVKEGEIKLKDLNQILRDIELVEFKKAASKAAENGVSLKLLDYTKLLLLRPDGHPGPYREFHPFAKDKNATVQNDCLHWCLPGPMDSWNDVIMEMVINWLNKSQS